MFNHPEIVRREDTTAAYAASVERVINYMKAHLEDPLDLDRLAQLGATSKFHFVRIFAEVTGITPHYFLASLRIQRAKELLLISHDSITDICMAVGYSSLGTFSRIFHTLVGTSPKEFREINPERIISNTLAAMSGLISAPQSGPTIAGTVRAPNPARGLVFVGAFSKGVPQGMPDSGTVLLGPGPFCIGQPHRPSFRLLAIFLPFNVTGMELLTGNFQSALVASQRCSLSAASTQPELLLRLRASRPFDPPVVVSLPALLRTNPVA